nr:immunoglobulin heavy chain junction region [Macaca mulatta]MPN83301.1 immunoglobulin heavy chain junction region [Macaca mulatta]MPN83324.1 immunoglobulin heavy chain junction region [Macaca mulatta]MPN83374.1 immunoglobulin heavy chain junction region [Macaca mulatta]MPN83403.1 immunoglobulin heavy chain junction region [Macaca mulatta]
CARDTPDSVLVVVAANYYGLDSW